MIKMYDCEMTAGAVRKVEEKAGKEVNKFLKDELKQIIYEMKDEEEIQADADLNYIWLDEECKGICSLPDKNFFGQVEELGVYVSIWEQDGEYLTYNDYSDFRDIYLGGDYSFASQEKMEVFAERFQNNLKDIIWDDEDNELKRAVDEELNQIKNDEEGEDTIEFIGNKFTTVMDEIAEYVEFKDDEHEVKGFYSGEKIYRIKNKLYYLTDDSWSCNTEYHWYLKELGPKGYEYFKMERPNGEEEELNEIENDEEGEDLIRFVGNRCTSLIEEIEEYVEYNDDDYEVKGYYLREKIYRIKNRLYYLTDDSRTCNTEYYWFLQELGQKGYEYFRMEKPIN